MLDEAMHVWGEATCQHLGEKFSETVYQANWPVVTNSTRILFLAK